LSNWESREKDDYSGVWRILREIFANTSPYVLMLERAHKSEMDLKGLICSGVGILMERQYGQVASKWADS
jgi:hypothetical protein